MLAAGVVAAILAVGSPLSAQDKKPYPIFTYEQFVAAMKTVGQAFNAVTASLSRNEIDDAKAYLAISRDRLATTIVFWRDRKRDDAIRLLRDNLAKLDELDAALSVERVDRAGVDALANQVTASCQNCHNVYRDQDPVTKAYRLKPGTAE
jgi:hypothetical protein